MSTALKTLTEKAIDVVREIGDHAHHVAQQHAWAVDKMKIRIVILERELAASTMENAALRQDLAALTIARRAPEPVQLPAQATAPVSG